MIIFVMMEKTDKELLEEEIKKTAEIRRRFKAGEGKDYTFEEFKKVIRL